MSAQAPTKSSARTAWLVVALAAGLHVASAAWHVGFGGMNSDEGFYAVATRAVAQGEMPYRDFGFSQPPLVLYANCLPLSAVGFGLFAQRAVNGLWAALALALAARWLAGRTRWEWGVALAVGFSLSAPWMYFIHLGKTYGFTTLLVMLAAWAFLTLCAGPRRNAVLGLLAALGVGTRLATAPFFGLLWLLALWPGRRATAREVLAAVLSAGLGAAAVALPFWLAAPESVKFWVIDLHRLSLPYRDWRVGWDEIATLAPATWTMSGVAVTVVLRRRRLASREVGVMLASSAALAANLLPGGVYDEYGVPFLLPLAAAAAALVSDEMASRSRAAVTAVAACLVAAQFLAAPILSRVPLARRGVASCWLTPTAPPYNQALPTQLAIARQIVEHSLAPGAPFIGPNLILAAETGRNVPSGLRMGPFSFTVEIPPDRAARLHLVTHEELDVWFARPDVTVLAFFPRQVFNYGWTMPTFGQLSEDFHAQWFAPLRRDFAVAYETDADFLLLVRKPAADQR